MSSAMRPGRRRALAILAAAGGMPLPAIGANVAPTWSWDGVALGAAARIRLHGVDAAPARRIVADCVAELRRLEAAFSLYRPDSEISRLNRDGALDAPSRDFASLMRCATEWSELTRGAFDATVQPLWRLHADHFVDRPSDAHGPSPALLEAACARVDYRAVDVSARRIAFARAGMAVTLNGIAQGYITDRIVERLHDAGIGSTLVEMGEIAARGRRADGTPWLVGVPDHEGRVATTLALRDRAVATSAGRATPFEPTRRFHHLFVPRTGECAAELAVVSVIAGSATAADALSTALFVTPRAQLAAMHERVARATGAVEAILRSPDGQPFRLAGGPASETTSSLEPRKGPDQ